VHYTHAALAVIMPVISSVGRGASSMKGIKSGKVIGTRIKQRRRSLGLSQEKLAVALGVSYQQVQRYENGTNLLSTDKLQIVAEFLEVPASYFFKDEAGLEEAGLDYESSAEAKLLRRYRKIDERYKKCVSTFIELAAHKRSLKETA